MTRTAEYSLLHPRRNEDIVEYIKEGPVEKKVAHYKQKWLYYVSRMEIITYPKNSLNIDLSEEEEEEDLDDH